MIYRSESGLLTFVGASTQYVLIALPPDANSSIEVVAAVVRSSTVAGSTCSLNDNSAAAAGGTTRGYYFVDKGTGLDAWDALPLPWFGDGLVLQVDAGGAAYVSYTIVYRVVPNQRA